MSASDRWLVSPKIFKPAGRLFGIAAGVLDVLVPKIKLDGTRVVASICQVIAGGMAQHVRMNWKLDAGGFCGLGNDVIDGAPRPCSSTERGAEFYLLAVSR